MLRKIVEAFALISALAGPVSAASVELSPVGERVGQTVYALALAGDIKSGDDLRVASLLGKALVEEHSPGTSCSRQMVATQAHHSALRALHIPTVYRLSSAQNVSAPVRSLP